ncbi:putative prolyl aminopeptidase [Arthrobacter sp. PAMC 25486]|uniref:alpha/beta fold hydrolase n=1 Tax=Arthrobacter sp. PAMC 25486 TaxID=1494608 RepID=UPI000535F9FB|nr:alpha/beta fold hydrolase [Arthrobacter sp. PAMC 25486]AIY02204.1 putative prolyl aminopeptidase [Arthrobacter sp. PAMC 25486]
MNETKYIIPGMAVTDFFTTVPLDWFDPAATETITVFARELMDPVRRHEDLPVMVFLQGGPGGKGPRPLSPAGWIGQALKTHRVLLLDQRGTGRSTRIDAATMARFGEGAAGAAAGADYLSHFRADSIVSDAEHIRKTRFGGRRWSTMGQSYGGFLTLTYLSRAPEALEACYVTGGLASIWPDASEVYRRTFPRTAGKNHEFYARYPHQLKQAAAVADHLANHDVRLPDGDRLTVRRFQTLGIDYGMKPGFERMHWLLEEAFTEAGTLSDGFLAQVLARTSFADNPLFAALQESIYSHGGNGPTNWAAQRERDNHPEFAETARPLMFTGEMMFPWMFEEIRLLRPFAGAVNELARRETFSELYDLDRLAANEVPVAAAVYFDDMYVDAGLQLATASAVGNVHAWVTNEFEHDGIGDDKVFAYLRSTIDRLGGGITT